MQVSSLPGEGGRGWLGVCRYVGVWDKSFFINVFLSGSDKRLKEGKNIIEAL